MISYKSHSKLHDILCTCYLWPWLGPSVTTMQNVMYFRFCVWRRVFTQYGVRRSFRLRDNSQREATQRCTASAISFACRWLTSLGRKIRRTQLRLAVEVNSALRTGSKSAIIECLVSLYNSCINVSSFIVLYIANEAPLEKRGKFYYRI